MKRTLLAITLIASVAGMAQQQLPNSNLDAWTNMGSFDEPDGWSSLKTATGPAAAFAPEVLFQDAGRGGSGSSAKLEAVNSGVGGIIANGLITNGRVYADWVPANGYVFTDSTDAQWHTSFTDRPDSLVGWFKHSEPAADPGKVEIIFHELDGQLPEAGTSANIIGRARYNPTGNVSTWTRFSVAVDWIDSRTPKFALLVANAGDSTASLEGTILWIDDLELIYNPVGLEEHTDRYNVWSDLGVVYVDLLEKEQGTGIKTMELMDLSGKKVFEADLESGKCMEFRPEVNPGVYVVRIKGENTLSSQRVFIQ